MHWLGQRFVQSGEQRRFWKNEFQRDGRKRGLRWIRKRGLRWIRKRGLRWVGARELWRISKRELRWIQQRQLWWGRSGEQGRIRRHQRFRGRIRSCGQRWIGQHHPVWWWGHQLWWSDQRHQLRWCGSGWQGRDDGVALWRRNGCGWGIGRQCRRQYIPGVPHDDHPERSG